MDQHQFTALKDSFGSVPSRRDILRGLAGAGRRPRQPATGRCRVGQEQEDRQEEDQEEGHAAALHAELRRTHLWQ